MTSAEDAVLHRAPDRRQALMDLRGCAPDQLIPPHDFRHGQAMGVAVPEEVFRRFDGKGERDGELALVGLAVLNDEAAANGVVRLADARAVHQHGRERHAIGMLRETAQGVESAAGCGIEMHRTLAAEHEASRLADRLDSRGDGGRVAGDGVFIREAEHGRHVGHVPPAGLREGAVEVDLDFHDRVEDTELLPALHRSLGRPPRPESVGARRAHTDLEDVESTDGGDRRALPWRELKRGLEHARWDHAGQCVSTAAVLTVDGGHEGGWRSRSCHWRLR